MAIAVDTSVIMDVLLDDPEFASRSRIAIESAAAEEGLVISETVVAEIVPALDAGAVEEFLADWNIKFTASTVSSAVMAGKMYATYLKRGGQRQRVVPDFLIGAHAQLQANGLLARDRGYYRDYFKSLRVIDPSQGDGGEMALRF